jgi:hypothetical protein
MVNVHFKWRSVSKFKGLIDLFDNWSWEDKERAKLRKEMLVEFKLEHYSVIGS